MDSYEQSPTDTTFFHKQFYKDGQPQVLSLHYHNSNWDVTYIVDGVIKNGAPVFYTSCKVLGPFQTKIEAFNFAENFAKENGFITMPEESKLKYVWGPEGQLYFRDNPILEKKWKEKYPEAPFNHEWYFIDSSFSFWICDPPAYQSSLSPV